MANYLWWGGEDTSFPNGATPTVTTNGAIYRSGYARSAISGGTAASPCKSTLFPGGAVTSAWFSFRHYSSNQVYIGLGKSGQNNFLAINCNSTTYSIGTVVSGSFTALTSSVVIPTLGVDKLDLQVNGYGGTTTINLYANGQQIISYSGTVSISGVSGFDSIFYGGTACYSSEMVVSDSSTLAFLGAVTVAGSGNGTTQQWSNPAYTNWNPTTISDINSTYTNTTGQDEQATITSLPTGSFNIAGVKIEARAMATSGATATNLKLGFRNASGTVAVNPQHALTTVFTTYEDYFTTDPTTSSAWSTLTSYQLDLRSA